VSVRASADFPGACCSSSCLEGGGRTLLLEHEMQLSSSSRKG